MTNPRCSRRSPRTALVAVAIAVPALLLGLDSLLARNPGLRNYEVFYEMVDSRAYESYTPNPNFPDGTTEQAPPTGTIARGMLPWPEGTEPDNPYPADDPAVLARGAQVYAAQCMVCHGPQGAGDGVVVFRGVPAPPTLATGNTPKLTDAAIYKLITGGGTNMPAYGPHLSRADRWKVVRYIRGFAAQVDQADQGQSQEQDR